MNIETAQFPEGKQTLSVAFTGCCGVHPNKTGKAGLASWTEQEWSHAFSNMDTKAKRKLIEISDKT